MTDQHLISPHDLALYIDHSALSPDTTEERVTTLCREAERFGFAAVCVMPYFVPHAVRLFDESGSGLPVCTVIGFPNGAHRTLVKVAEAEQALADGAVELDMVMNLSALKSGRLEAVLEDIRRVADTVHDHDALLKVILETALLSDDEKKRACELAVRGGADFVKTSTGFGGGGATVADVALLRASAPEEVLVKASGGIRDRAAAIAMIRAGADRLGTSASVAIVSAPAD